MTCWLEQVLAANRRGGLVPGGERGILRLSEGLIAPAAWLGRLLLRVRGGTVARRGEWLAAPFLLLSGGALFLAGAALYSDRISVRRLLTALPGTALLRVVYEIHAALPHRVVQSAEGILAGLGLELVLLAVLLWLRRIPLRLVAGLLGALLLLGVAAVVGLRVADPYDGVATFDSPSRRHQQEPIVAPKIPPAGGPHSPIWQNCGVYDAPVPVGQAVHSLEHGAVWIAYRPGLASDEVAALREVTWAGSHRLLSPYPELLAPIVVTAWRHQLLLDRADDPRLQRFIARYEEDPNGPEPGIPCSGGGGTPLAGP